MYKIDKKVFIGFVSMVTGIGIACSIGAFKSGNSFFNSDQSSDIVQVKDNYLNTAVFLNDGVAILIPCNSYFNENGIIHLDDYQFSANNISIFTSNGEASSYEQAINFSLALANEIYNYEDVLNGNYNNIVLAYKIESEMGIIKKKDL